MLHLVNRIYSEISVISNSVLLRNYKIYNLSVLFKTQLGQFFTNVQGLNFYSWAALVTSLSHKRSSFAQDGKPFFQLLYYTFSAVVLDFVFLSVFVFTEFNSAYSLNVRVVKKNLRTGLYQEVPLTLMMNLYSSIKILNLYNIHLF